LDLIIQLTVTESDHFGQLIIPRRLSVLLVIVSFPVL